MSFQRPENWNDLIAALPGAHILQTAEWGAVKSRYGWNPLYRIWNDDRGDTVAAVQILERSVRLPLLPIEFNMLYCPKGPLLDWSDKSLRERVLFDLGDIARQRKAVFVKIDPDVRSGLGVPSESNSVDVMEGIDAVEHLQKHGWIFSEEQVQFRNTIMIDLIPSEEELLAQMKQKTRYNVRLASRKGVSVRSGTPSDFNMLYQMYTQTAHRDGFVIRHEDYYMDVWNTFFTAGMLIPLIAMVDDGAVGAVMLFRFAQKTWYLYGMSTQEHREKMPNYLLQWEAIRQAKSANCEIYDLWGAPDHFDESEKLWGVYRFKRGLGGQIVRHIGAWDFILRPTMYKLFTSVLPRILSIMRRAAKSRTSYRVQHQAPDFH